MQRVRSHGYAFGVKTAIARVADRLSAGEMDLWEVTPQEAAEAKARLDAKRAKRRSA